MPLDWRPVTSSMLSAVAHDGRSLHVRYKNGGTYVHPGVPEAKFRALLSAGSKGEYFNKQIKPHHPVGN